MAIVVALMNPTNISWATDKPISSRLQEVYSGGAQAKDEVVVTYSGTDFFVQDFSIPSVPGLEGYRAVFPPCSEVTGSNCIESIEMKKATQDIWIRGTLAYQFEAKNRSTLTAMKNTATNKFWYFGDSKADDNSEGVNFGGASFWKFPDFEHEGGEMYKVAVEYSTFPVGNSKNPNNYNFNVLPIKAYQPSFPATCTETAYLGPIDVQRLPSCGPGLSKISPEPKEFTHTTYDFPDNIQIRLKVKLGKLNRFLSTWFNGRIAKPDINFEADALTISGSPLRIPISQTSIMKCSALTIQQKNRIFASTENPNSCSNGNFGYNWFSQTSGYSAMQTFELFEPYVHELGKRTLWTLNSFSDESRCQIRALAGLVTSNAQVYESAVPQFNSEGDSLEFSIASPHLDSTGQPNRGNLHIVLNKDFANCLWRTNDKFSLQFAKIQITNSDGDTKVGTISLHDTPDWIYFDMTNFGYSNPKISITYVDPNKKFQDSPTVTSNSAGVKKTSRKITCIKGKTKKVISGTAVKCPAGYRLKF